MCPVLELSDEEAEAGPSEANPRKRKASWDAIRDLSPSSSLDERDLKDVGMKKRVKRRRKVDGALTLKERLKDDMMCKKTLGRMCKGCRKPCLQPFLQEASFANFKHFREMWSETHKLDQDRVAAWMIV